MKKVHGEKSRGEQVKLTRDLSLHAIEAVEAPRVWKQCLGQTESTGLLKAQVSSRGVGWGEVPEILKAHYGQAQGAQRREGRAPRTALTDHI